MFPVETISAKMLDYYVGRRDTLIIDLREKESYMHSHVKGASALTARHSQSQSPIQKTAENLHQADTPDFP